MVKRIVRYGCEWPGCGKEYDDHASAERCQRQGLLGPEIAPGLVLDFNGRGFYIFTAAGSEGHQRVYSYLDLQSGFSDLEELAASCEGKNPEQAYFQFSQMYTRQLYSLKDSGLLHTLAEELFLNLSRLIERCPSLAGINACVSRSAPDGLYRTHPFFTEEN
ncbi:hypothetical protein JXB02_01775 [Candidatus Woesearchaeota archaeon]|nr:hypothetical protein [Candidatus Woesearchaeota archaeon]